MSVFDALGKTPTGYNNIVRWYKNIASYSVKERQQWAGQILPHLAGAKPTADDDDVDLFGSDEEDNEEADRIKAERVKAYTEKKSKKTAIIAKSSILLDVKPWDDETDMKQLEKHVRSVVMDGMVWGASKLVPLAYGIMKLQIICVIEDEKVSVDELQEKLQEFEDFVQSVDIAAFNKI